MDHGTFYEMLERWGLSNRKKSKGEMEIMETVEAKELTYDVYKQLKTQGVSARAIAGKYGMKENTLYTKVHKWKKKEENETKYQETKEQVKEAASVDFLEST